MISLKVEMKAVLVYQTNHFNYLKKVSLNSLKKNLAANHYCKLFHQLKFQD